MRLASEGSVPVPLEAFQRLDLGLPFVSAESRLTLDVLDQCAADHPPLLALHTQQLRTIVMGVDVGSVLHVVVRGLYRRKWSLLEAFTCSSFDELETWFNRYRVSVCVVDSLPETRRSGDLPRGTLEGSGFHATSTGQRRRFGPIHPTGRSRLPAPRCSMKPSRASGRGCMCCRGTTRVSRMVSTSSS